MNRMLRTAAFAIVGYGLLAGSLAWADPERTHAEWRERVLAEIGDARAPAGVLHAALRRDPGFARMLDYFRCRTLEAVRHAPDGEDAVQETFLKIWKGRPDIFLKSHDDVVRYLRGAARKNLVTLLRRGAAPRGLTRTAADLCDEIAPSGDPTVGAELESRELLERLAERLGPEERAILALRLAGAASERDLARVAGSSRYAVGRASDCIRREWERLMEGGNGSAA